MAGQASELTLLRDEIVQRRDEGCAIPDELIDRIQRIANEWDRDTIAPLFDELEALEPDAELAANEPNDLDAIRALRPPGPRNLAWNPGERELLDKLHGAWTGRCVGCALGKPVESMGMGAYESPRLAIKDYLQKRGDWPLSDFFSGDLPCKASHREHIAYMEPDDDIHYSLTGLAILEQRGRDFNWRDVGRFWLEHIPIAMIFTAEAQAVLNLQSRSCVGIGGDASPEFTRRRRNPYREWIGAQIRADGWAWCCAGNPELAAEFAWRDAHWTHERNGIYGEMFYAAMIAAAFVESDLDRLIDVALSEIPANCRLARFVRQLRGWFSECADFESCMSKVEVALRGMHPVHTINNALVVLIGLHYGRLDPTDSPAIAVMCGLDTDCNGATCGSITGAIHGHTGRSRLADRLNDTIRPAMVGFESLKMRDLAIRTAAVRHRLCG